MDQPLCIECSRDVVRQVDMSVKEAEDDIAAYQAALDTLKQENLQPMSSQVGAFWDVTGLCTCWAFPDEFSYLWMFLSELRSTTVPVTLL